MRPLSPLALALFALACDGPHDGQRATSDTSAADAAVVDTSTSLTDADTAVSPSLVSRFSPSRGLGGTPVRIVTTFSPDGCAAAGQCAVTIDGEPAEIVSDEGLLEVLAPRWVSTGPLCVTWRGQTECGETFTVMQGPLVHSYTPTWSHVAVRDFVLEVVGEGFSHSTEVWFNGEPLRTHLYWPNTLRAVVPYRLVVSPGTYTVDVFVPDVNRCGARSEGVTFTVEDPSSPRQ